MSPDPAIVVHAPLPPPADEDDVAYVPEGESRGRGAEAEGRGAEAEGRGAEAEGREEEHTLPPDPYRVMLRAPEELLDPATRASLAAAIDEAGATSIHVELAGFSDVGPDLISGLRQLGSETGAARIDVHASTE